MTYPKRNDTDEKWTEWLERVAPFRGLCDRELHHDLRYLSSIEDRKLALLSARCAVITLQNRRAI